MENLKELLKRLTEDEAEAVAGAAAAAKQAEEPHEEEPESSEKEKVPSKEKLMAWIGKHKDFEDEDLHAWVGENGWNIHEVEDMIYKFAYDHVKECLAEKKGKKDEEE